MKWNALSRPAVILAVLCMSTSAIFIRLATAPSVVLALYRMALSALLTWGFERPVARLLARKWAKWREGKTRSV